MAEASLYGRSLGTFFDLLGEDEPALTNAVGWGLAESPRFRNLLLRHVFGELGSAEGHPILVRLQPYAKSGGFTDIEVIVPGDLMVIIEAKRGWALPSAEQLAKYAPRFDEMATRRRAYIVLTEATEHYARSRSLPTSIAGVPLVHMRWADLIRLSNQSRNDAPHSEKRLLVSLANYLGEKTSMRKLDNMVYVVSLSAEKPEGASISFIDVVEKKGVYFHPFGTGGWPKEPPTYMGFRYAGRLQSVRFVEAYKIIADLAEDIPEMGSHSAVHPGEHFLYRLGPPVAPAKPVLSKGVWPSGRVWCMIDALLTADTIGQAVAISESRRTGT